MFDGCLISASPRSPKARVVLVGLGETSLDELGRPLAYLSPELAEVIRYLERRGAGAVGLDLIVPEGLRDWKGLDAGGPGDAEVLGRAIAEARNVVLAKWLVDAEGLDSSETAQRRWLLPLPQWRLKNLAQPAPTDLGFINLTEDEDRFVRRQVLAVGTEEAPHYHFALALYALAHRLDLRRQEGELWLGGSRIPLDSRGAMRIRYAGPPGTFPTLRFNDLLAWARRGESNPPYDFKGALVIIGVTGGGSGGHDFHPTPYSNQRLQDLLRPREAGLMSGPEIHANIIDTLATRGFIHSAGRWVTLALLLLYGAPLGFALSRLNLEWGAALTLGCHFAWKYLAVGMFSAFSLRIEIVPFLLLGVVAYAVTFAMRWRRLRRMMGVVKSESITRALESGAASLDQRGELRVVTVLFCDIRGFTDYSHHHTPHEVVSLLNAYFSEIVPIIESHGGTLNQYMGDGVMVIFNAPELQEDHSLRAVEAAAAMVRRVHEREDLWVRLGKPGFRIGVGVHRGEAVVGTLGSPRRLDYSAIGDTVNIAARLESENKALGSEILISGETSRALRGEDRLRLGVVEPPVLLQVKGVDRTVEAHRIEIADRDNPARGAEQ
jgi:class 3 adenylate cyclase/CHASE2 domain-containing sensor protein